MMFFLIHAIFLYVYIWVYRMPADDGEKYTYQHCAKWLVTQHHWEVHPSRQRCMIGFSICLLTQRTCSTAESFVRESSKLSSSRQLPGSQVWWRELVWRARKQMFESFMEQCLHLEMTSEMNRELMEFLEDQCKVLCTASASQEGNVCSNCLSPEAVCKHCWMWAIWQLSSWWRSHE